MRYMIGTTHLNLNESFEEIVKKLAATLEANYNISTKVYIGSTKILHLSENVQIELIRILQEALSNISRHANAGNVEIRFVDGIDDFRFIIKDDGKGFSEEEVELKNKQSAKKALRRFKHQRARGTFGRHCQFYKRGRNNNCNHN